MNGTAYIGHSISELAPDLAAQRVIEIGYRKLPNDYRGKVKPGDPARPSTLPRRCILSAISIYTETTTATAEQEDRAIRWWITADRAGRIVLVPATTTTMTTGPVGLGGVAAALEVVHAQVESSDGIYVWMESASDDAPEGAFRARVWWRVLAPEDVPRSLCELVADRLNAGE